MIEETFSVDAAPNIEVRIQTGRVELRPGSPGTVRVTVDTRDPDLYVEQRGNTIVVSSEKNTSWLSRGSSFVEIETPEGADLYVGAASAQVESAVRLNKAEVKTASGDVELEDADTVVIKSASGDARIGSIERALRFNSASGSLRVTGKSRGSVAITTASGDVHIEDVDATVNINTVSGDIDIRRLAGKSAAFKSMSGSIDLRIPRGTEVDLDVSLLSGRLNLPEPEHPQEGAQRSMSIRAKSVSGDLTIDRV